MHSSSTRPCSFHPKFLISTVLFSLLYFHLAVFAQVTGEVRTEASPLELNRPMQRDLAGGQRHLYTFSLNEGQYFKLEVKARDVSLNISIRRPNGRDITVFDSLGRVMDGAVQRVATVSGEYQFTVFARPNATAGSYELRIAELRQATDDERSLEEAREANDEALRLNMEGRLLEARPLLVRSLEIRERVLGPEHFLLRETLNRLAVNFAQSGDYASAVPLQLRAVKISERVRGTDHPDLTQYLLALASMYLEKGDYLRSEETFLRTLNILEKSQMSESHFAASMFGGLGLLYYSLEDYPKAENYYHRSRAVLEKLYGPEHFHLETTYLLLGQVAYDAGEYSKAKMMFERGLELREKALGPDEQKIPNVLSFLAEAYIATGDVDRAESFYRRAMSIHTKYGLTDPYVEQTLYGLARLASIRGRTSDALKLQSQAAEIEESRVQINLRTGSERERLAFLSSYSSRSSRNISLYTSAPNDPLAKTLAATTILRLKGRVQDAVGDSMAASRRRSGAGGQRVFDELSRTTSQLAKLNIDGPQAGAFEEHQRKIKALQDKREELEAEISRQSAGFYEKAQAINLASVKAAIPENAALIEFLIYRPFNPTAADHSKAYGEPRYIAYVLNSRGAVQLKDLGPAIEINETVNRFRKAVRDPQRRDVQMLARELNAKVFRPFRALLGGAKNLLISPDGELNLVPFEAFIDEKGKYLVESYSVSYLTTGRDLMRMQVPRTSKSQPTVVADPVYGEQAPDALEATAATAQPIAKRSSVTNTGTLSETYFAPLGGTAREAASIKELFPEFKVLTGASATETAVKELEAPKILHIATHGFFLDDSRTAERGKRAMAPTNNTKIENPLLRSGLALAGANRRGDARDDGILTALEASGLNLWGTKLVVLSACDTGIGEIRNGDGVYGLRRSFVMAGAETLIMSLWPVSDYVTRELMTNYYKNLKTGMGRGDSLRHVQLSMIKNPNRRHPFYWASFIQSGEWANLDGKRP